MAWVASSMQIIQAPLISGQAIAGKAFVRQLAQSTCEPATSFAGSFSPYCRAYEVSQRKGHRRWASNPLMKHLEAKRLVASGLKRALGRQGLVRHGAPALETRRRGISCSVTTEAPTDVDLDRAFGSIELIGLDGNRKKVTELWKDRKVVVAWGRHFGCVLCRKYAALLAERKADFEAAGVDLIFIGPGSEKQANAFKNELRFPGEVYADPTQDSFRALGFASGIGSVVTPEAGLNVVNALKEGFKMDWGTSLQKDTVLKGAWQQGGTLIVGPGSDNIHYLRKDRWAGDHPAVKDLLQSLNE